MSSLAPRVVLVTRATEFDRLLATHATRGQAAFFVRSRGQSIDPLDVRRRRQSDAVDLVKRAVPADWSVAQVLRDDLDRFLFTADDIVIAVGQDGLVANLAKYLSGQPVIGITPDAGETEGVLTPYPAEVLPGLLPRIAAGDYDVEARTMVEARLDNGQSLAALNELFIGHRSHQSARYLLTAGDGAEYQSSSGIIVSTGTGMTGWARSILTATRREAALAPADRRAVYFVREPWPSRVTGCNQVFGEVEEGGRITVTSRMNDGGVIFADGIEQDFLPFNWGIEASVTVSPKVLRLVRAV